MFSDAPVRTLCCGLVAAVLVAVGFVTPAGGEEGKAPSPPAADAARQEMLKRFEYLTKLYADQLDSNDWMTRSVAMISLARMPTQGATKVILQRLESEKHPVGLLVAWQAMLGRAGMLSEEQYRAWRKATLNMAGAGLFQGNLRIGLLEMFGAETPDMASRHYFRRIFEEANSLDSSDIPTLIAMGRALRGWGDGQLVAWLISKLRSPDTAVRAELVLQAAGADVEWNRTAQAEKVYQKWWKQSEQTFTAVRRSKEGWRKLKPQFIPAPLDPSSIDPKDRKWIQELEIGRLELEKFDFAIAIDCSRSMRPEIERLKRDVGVMFTAIGAVAREARMGLTFFAPGGIVKTIPLTGDERRLMSRLQEADIMGPAGEEEWAGAIDETIKAGSWSPPGQFARRVIVLISDEPITDPQFKRAKPLVKKGAEDGFRLYGVMILGQGKSRNNPLALPFDRTGRYEHDDGPKADKARKGRQAKAKASKKAGRSWDYYDELAEATGGQAIAAHVPQGGLGLGKPIEHGAKGGKGTSPVAIAPIYPGGGPTTSVLTMVLTDAIHPQYRDRVGPFIDILVAYCQKSAKRVPERRSWGPPDKMEPNRPLR